MKIGVVTFPGSNGDYDSYKAVQEGLGAQAVFLWHKTHDLQGVDAVVLPGGFSYGDYLRCGAMAAHSPIMREVKAFADEGGPVVGFCNGFQILCESGLLPGALIRNRSLRFISRPVHLRVENTATPFTAEYDAGEVIELPVAHGEGCYVAPDGVLSELEDGGRVVFRYASADGVVDAAVNPNGSVANIAGILNAAGNVLGMMPHPERAVDETLGNDDGSRLFRSLAAHLGRA